MTALLLKHWILWLILSVLAVNTIAKTRASIRTAKDLRAKQQRPAWQATATQQQRTAQAPSADARWTSSDPHVILGVTPCADQTTIRSAFATLSKQYHPDRVANLAPEFQKLAEARMKTINAAYAALRRN